MRTILYVLSVLYVLDLPLHAEEQPVPQASVEKVLERIIELHEKQDYLAYFKECVSPKSLEAILKKRPENETVDEFLTRVYSSKAPANYFTQLIATWKKNRGTSPTFNEAQTVATYPTQSTTISDHERMVSTLVFEKEGSQWYVSLAKSRTDQVLTGTKKQRQQP